MTQKQITTFLIEEFQQFDSTSELMDYCKANNIKVAGEYGGYIY